MPTIHEATGADIPALVELLVLTLGETAMYDVIFVSDPENAMQKGMHGGRLKGLMGDPNARVFKLVLEDDEGSLKPSDSDDPGQGQGNEGQGGRIVGCIAFTLDSGEAQDGPLGPGTATASGNRIRGSQFPPGLNTKALDVVLGGIARLIDTMKGKHYGISMLGVHPAYRSHRLGSRLLGHCLEIADREGIDTWLCALPGSHRLYLRQGFEDKEYDDVDLDKVDPLDRKFGMFRHQAMFRAARTD